MKKQTKSNLQTSLQSLAVVFGMFLVMALACDDDTQTGSSNLPVIAGTAWKIDPKIKGGSPVQTYLFCKSGRWEVISSRFLGHTDIPGSRTGGGITFAGTYTVKGDTLISKMDNEQKTDIYKMSWDGSRLKLDDGQVILELYEPITTECQ